MGSPRPGARKHACACTHTDTLVQTDAVTRAHTGATLPPCFRAAMGRLSPLQMPTRMCPGPARPLPGAAVGPRWATCVPGSPAASWDRALRRGSASPLVELGAVSLACLYFREWLPAPANTGRVSCAAPPRPPADPLRPALKEPPPPGPPAQRSFRPGPSSGSRLPLLGPHSHCHTGRSGLGALCSLHPVRAAWYRRGVDTKPTARGRRQQPAPAGSFQEVGCGGVCRTPLRERGRAEGARGRGGEGAWPWAWGRVRPGRAVAGVCRQHSLFSLTSERGLPHRKAVPGQLCLYGDVTGDPGAT